MDHPKHPRTDTSSAFMISAGAAPSVESHLLFAPTHRPEGFTNSHLSGFDGSPEPIVRELLQNALDAGRDAARPVVQVRFEITEMQTRSIPGWGSYRNAFALAQQQRNSATSSHDESMAIDRIRSRAARDNVTLLICSDNGVGLDPRRMDAVLTSGNTSKGTAGAGSFGLGHHAAFAASDLRYVIYASRYGANGQHNTLMSGHAILATHTVGDELRAADGYLRPSDARSAFDGTADPYCSVVPEHLTRWGADGPGTTVCVVGFNRFRRTDKDPDPVDSICRAAATNFCDAITQGAMTVEASDARTTSLVDQASIGQILAEHSANKRANRAGLLSGRVAHAAYQTLTQGLPIAAPMPGVRLRWRPLQDDAQHVTRLHVFRRGMWITSRDDALVRALSDCQPVDAVLCLDGGDLEGLVRRAEGPEHQGIQRRRLNPGQRKKMRGLLQTVCDAVVAAAGVRDHTSDYIPPGFADVGGYVVASAEMLPRPRRANRGTRPSAQPTGSTPGKRNRGQGRSRPRPGTRPAYRSVLRPESDTTIAARLEYAEPADAASEMIGVRLSRVSAGDATCDTPPPDEPLDLAEVLVHDSAGAEPQPATRRDQWEMLVPASRGLCEMTIKTVEPMGDPSLIELDIVKRSPTAEPAQ